MKWNKFKALLDSNYWLQFHIGPPALQSLRLNVPAKEAERGLKDYVRTRLDYIAFRPFEQLDLQVCDTDESVVVPNPKYRNIKFTEGTSTQYVIRFHIEGVEYPFHRVRYVYDHGSIAAAIKHLVKWHGETSWGGPRGRALKIDAVVKVSSYYHEVSQVGMQHIEAYEFPKDFDLKKFEGEVAA